jgi:hypothetical protein
MENFPQVAEPKKRPDFLTVLCILTFLGSGLGIFNNLTKYVNSDIISSVAKEAIDMSKENIDSAGSTESGKKLADKLLSGASDLMNPAKLKQNYLLSMISNAITLLGAFLMFRLKKIGYWTYVAGIVVLVATPLIIFGAGNILSLGMTLGLGFVGILFIVLYSLNLKHLA